MRLQKLSLETFRSYTSLQLEFADDNIHVFLGENAAGKTNILESIALLSLAKSSQGIDEADLFTWNAPFYKVRGEVLCDNGEKKTLEIASQIEPRKKKVCFVQDVQVSAGQLIGTLPIVVFFPQNLDLFTGSPQQRRSFLDQLLCQVSPVHLIALSKYQKILKQRNKLLRSIADGKAKESDLLIWNAVLAKEAATIMLNRLELVEMFQCALQDEIASLGEQWEGVHLVYERKGSGRTVESIQKEIEDLLLAYQNRDIILQSTSIGPHRDDWRLDVQGRSLPTFASRGQQRATVLALLMLEVSYLELQRGEKPVILLDDVFSELDDNHQSALLRTLIDHQVIITGTHIPPQLHGAVIWEKKGEGWGVRSGE